MTAAPCALRVLPLALLRHPTSGAWRKRVSAHAWCQHPPAQCHAASLSCRAKLEPSQATIERSWAYKKQVTREQMELLHAHLGDEEARGMSYERCVEVASALGLPYEAVRRPPGVGWDTRYLTCLRPHCFDAA